MGKLKLAETLSLDISQQKKVSKEVENVKKKLKKGELTIKEERKAQKFTAEQKRGLIFISHLPHGFYEDELKNYFKQFGKVTNVKVCRSKRTGRSKGYGYVEFAHPEVAKIAGETMNNYLMFKKRLSVEYVPYEKRPKNLFHGKSSTPSVYSAKTRRNKQYQANSEASEEKYSSRLKKRLSRVNKKMKKLSDMGIDIFPLQKSINKTGSDGAGDSPRGGLRMKLRNHDRQLQATKQNAGNLETKAEMLLDTSVNIVDPKLDKTKTNEGKIKKKKTTLKTSSNQTSKIASLNAETVKKIARELIRKRGPSLLHFPRTAKMTSKTKNK